MEGRVVGRIFSKWLQKKKTLTIDVIENQIYTEDVLLEKLETGSFVMNLSLQDGVNPSGASAYIYGENYEREVDFDSSGTFSKRIARR